jgi:class 3 adenylate cyclase
MNMVGDQLLAVFGGAVAAIRCGYAIRDAAQGLGMTIRVGIHAGEVEYDDGSISGITVHLPRLSHSVRGTADKAAYLMGWKSPYRQLPDSAG